ncbi:hypothetical protein IFR23_04655 [Sphingomonas sp. CFBP 13603]|uniref:hypothetical protein n=1 Tax=Sphingomonas sp. CFBP 13603 TaxID=2774040 RepID=UPI0018693B25|nr:hypothetical protein [Sphingomonas sp. CFBP 13603]MBE2991302.1 hypothetical protein [Sphingomonas sp. CFBP 13603]
MQRRPTAVLMQVEQAAPRTAPARASILPPTAPARRARVTQARAAYDGTVAVDRQTVLAVFQDVERQLVAPRILARQEALPRDAITESNRAEANTLNRYEARLITDTDMVTAHATARNARRNACRPRSTDKAAPGADLAIGRSMVAQRPRSGTFAAIAPVWGRISRSFRTIVEFVRPAQHRQL